MRRSLWHEANGSILVEALIVVPFITIISIGVLEFGNVFWQRQLLETGVKDAARYWARCQPSNQNCNQQIARQIAYFGFPQRTDKPRIPGWEDSGSLTITPQLPQAGRDHLITVTGRINYMSSPLYGLLGIAPTTIEITHQQRYVGW